MAHSLARAVQPDWPSLLRAEDILTTAAHNSPPWFPEAAGEQLMWRAGFGAQILEMGFSYD